MIKNPNRGRYPTVENAYDQESKSGGRYPTTENAHDQESKSGGRCPNTKSARGPEQMTVTEIMQKDDQIAAFPSNLTDMTTQEAIDIVDLHHLQPNQAARIRRILTKYSIVIAKSDFDVTVNNAIQGTIDLNDSLLKNCY